MEVFDDELSLDDLENVTAGYQSYDSELLMKLNKLKAELNNPANNEQDRKNIYDAIVNIEEELFSKKKSR